MVGRAGAGCVILADSARFNAECRLSDLSRICLTRYCLFDLKLNESSVRLTEKVNFLEITDWRGCGSPDVNFKGFKIR